MIIILTNKKKRNEELRRGGQKILQSSGVGATTTTELKVEEESGAGSLRAQCSGVLAITLGGGVGTCFPVHSSRQRSECVWCGRTGVGAESGLAGRVVTLFSFQGVC